MDTRLRQALQSVSAAVTTFLENASDYERLLQAVVTSVSSVLRATCIISLKSAATNTISAVAMHDEDEAVRATLAPLLGYPFALAEAKLVVGVMKTGTMFRPKVDLQALHGNVNPVMLDFWIRIGLDSLIAVPLRTRGEALGVMLVLAHREDRSSLDELDLEIAEHLAGHAALALGTAKLFREVRALESVRFVEAILENIPNMVFVKDAQTLQFARLNRAGEQLLGMSRDELLGKSDYDFFPPSEAEFFVAKDRETLAAGTLVEIPEEPIQTRTGQRWLHTKKVPILDDAGVPRYLLGISHDITEEKRNRAALLAANRELEAFSYSVAHDLRAPLRGVDGFAQALIEDYRDKLDATGLRYAERIRAAAQRMAQLIDALLDLSRVTRTEIKREPVDLSRVARASLSSLERAEPDRSVDTVIEDGMHATGDARLLGIVFDNLLGNAWKFTSKTQAPRIEVGTTTVGAERAFFVRDNGAGFDSAYGDKLFGVFQRLHVASDYPGTGIGLATVLRIVERHGGRVWADGDVGKGATFFFTLPEAT